MFVRRHNTTMLSRLLCGVLVSLVTLSGSVTAQAQPPQKNYARGHVLVKLREQAESRRDLVLSRVRARGARPIGNLKVHKVELPAGMSEQEAVHFLNQQPEVEFAEVDAWVPLAATPNDPYYANQWHLPNIGAPTAWDYTTGSAAVTIAVLDTGCDPTHPDLTPNYVSGWNFYDNNSNSADVHGHGTSVAGCASVAGNNSLGVASVSWNSRIMPLRVSDAAGSASYSTIASALTYAADRGAKIANISFANVMGSGSIQSAAQYMYSKGGLTVCGAGNTGGDTGFASNPYLICVSATDATNVKSSFSSFGNSITVTAPGSNIYSTKKGGGYGGGSGTSFSSPVVCGVLAMIWAANPNLTNAQVRNILINSVDDLGPAGWDNWYGYGKVNVGRAVVQAINTSGPQPDTTAPSVTLTNPLNGSTVAGTLTLAANATDTVGVTKVEFYANNTLLGTDTSASYTWNWNTLTLLNGTYVLKAIAYDAAGNAAQSSQVTVAVSNGADTTAPICAITSPSNNSKASNSLNVQVSASDNVGIARVDLYLDGQLTVTVTAAPYTFRLNSRNWSRGNHTLQAVAYDAAGNAGASASIIVRK